MNGVANPSPAPALIALNIFNELIWKKKISCLNVLILTPLVLLHVRVMQGSRQKNRVRSHWLLEEKNLGAKLFFLGAAE